jgi:hypothetical protein
MKHFFIIIAILLFATTVYADERVLECLHSKDACVVSCSGNTKCVKSCLSAYESCIHGGSKRQRPQESEKTYQYTIEIKGQQPQECENACHKNWGVCMGSCNGNNQCMNACNNAYGSCVYWCRKGQQTNQGDEGFDFKPKNKYKFNPDEWGKVD